MGIVMVYNTVVLLLAIIDWKMELNFNDILAGKDVQPALNLHQQKKLKQTDTRMRQQSCMIDDVDKDLLPTNMKAVVENYRVSLSDMLSMGQQDESLQRYKKALLGNLNKEELKEDEPVEVEIIQIQLVCPNRPKGNIILDFAHHNPKVVKNFTVKEASVYCMRIHFKVRNDIAFGLKFVNNVYKLFTKVGKNEDKMGSFAPQSKTHMFDLPWVQTPSGFFARGDYQGKALFLDNEGIVHCQFEYVLTIDSDW